MLTNVHGIMRDLEKEAARERFKAEQVRLACLYLRGEEIDRTCARYELESDEFLSREEKAVELLR